MLRLKESRKGSVIFFSSAGFSQILLRNRAFMVAADEGNRAAKRRSRLRRFKKYCGHSLAGIPPTCFRHLLSSVASAKEDAGRSLLALVFCFVSGDSALAEYKVSPWGETPQARCGNAQPCPRARLHF